MTRSPSLRELEPDSSYQQMAAVVLASGAVASTFFEPPSHDPALGRSPADTAISRLGSNGFWEQVDDHGQHRQAELIEPVQNPRPDPGRRKPADRTAFAVGAVRVNLKASWARMALIAR